MKLSGILICTFFCGASFAQITITESDLPEAGYTYFVSSDTLTAVNLGTPGSSAQTWDFSALLEHYIKVPTYDSTVNTPYAADFFASTHYTYGPAAMYSGFHGGAPVGSQGMNNGYMFWRRDNTGFWIVGFRSDDGDYANQNVLLIQQELMIGTPATYNDVFNNTARWELDFNDNGSDVDTLYVNNVEKTLTVDAFGELITPAGTYPDVLRIHEYLVTSDSAYATLMGNPVYELELKRDTLNNYIFMDNGTHYPLCIVHADKNNVVLSVEYYKGYSMAELEESDSEQTALYPNPSKGNFTVKVPADKDTETYLQVFDLNGRMVAKIRLTDELNTLDLNLRPALYFYSISTGSNTHSWGKIVITE
ncbi:MAG: T9SS type A sorting domain-containing protein [Bacteroidetes bacterium]|nr:T9SS type A sorting domain-containing protein [Bacteroidota bacterium]